jgi:hypothetical protein
VDQYHGAGNPKAGPTDEPVLMYGGYWAETIGIAHFLSSVSRFWAILIGCTAALNASGPPDHHRHRPFLHYETG